jgi:hypothetical protein
MFLHPTALFVRISTFRAEILSRWVVSATMDLAGRMRRRVDVDDFRIRFLILRARFVTKGRVNVGPALAADGSRAARVRFG